MYCKKCGEKLEDNANFCSKCGVAINQSITTTTVNENVKTSKKKPLIISIIQKIALWFYVILLSTWCLVYFPSIYSVIFFVCIAIVLPIKQWNRILPKRNFRVLIAIALTFFTIMILPTCEHEYVEVSIKEPTELSNGKLVQECSLCGDRIVTVLEKTNNSKECESNNNNQDSKPLMFLDDFIQYGYTLDQIESMKMILINVGVTEITDLEISNVSYGMQTIKGIAFKDQSLGGYKEVQVQFNIENGVIYLVHIYCPNGTPYLSGLTDRRADLYYNNAGGYLKRIDWQNKSVIDYNMSPVETDLNGLLIIGSDKQHPYVVTVENFYEELSKDFQEASQKYSGKWVKITGKVTDISDAGGYYIYGKKATTGYSGVKIICRGDSDSYSGIVVGSTKTFLGYINCITEGDPIEIGGCEIIKYQ